MRNEPQGLYIILYFVTGFKTLKLSLSYTLALRQLLEARKTLEMQVFPNAQASCLTSTTSLKPPKHRLQDVEQ